MVTDVRIAVQFISHCVISAVPWQNLGGNEAVNAVTATVFSLTQNLITQILKLINLTSGSVQSEAIQVLELRFWDNFTCVRP